VPKHSANATPQRHSPVELDQEEQQQLIEGLQALGLSTDGATLAKLRGYTELIRKWNKAINLVSRQDVERFVSRHLLDSLSITQLVADQPDAARVLDIGTGGGLPGIPLAIMLPQLQFTLADRSDKKIRFLNQVVRRLELTNVDAVAVDVARLAQLPERFGVVVSRAVAAPQVLWGLAAPLLSAQGRLILQTQVRAPDQAATADPSWADVQVTIEPHEVQVPGLQSVHDVLVLSQRKPR